MAGEFQELFQELLFGSGAWLGLIIIISIVLIVSATVKRSSIIFLPITIFMGIFYLQNVATDNNFMWAVIIMFLLTIFLGFRIVEEK